MGKRRYSFFISEELNAGLKELKDRDGVPEAESIRRAVGEYLEKKGIASTKKAARPRALTRERA